MTGVALPINAKFTLPIDDEVCTIENKDGVVTLIPPKGYKVISKLNGNSIFLPAAGFMMNTSLRSAGNQNINDGGMIGDYWSSSLYSNRPDYACREYFRSTFTRGTGYESRHYGFTIRPVYP